ncbi:hypothetical protein [Halapricum desulfuricans]|uniref:Uncharacterized protein n=1 Tax=Halapricum desulfuricans TaxID=2841257 RepID=A0A897N1R9_9EURY|nr:hypothetical protein [Halapricum desulfuricans]QSG08330.1 Uncharacterized protein HSR122_0926 [Halapricum desulfuricans]QSG12553.1 Uncharacterized protein HSBGL_2146 [Halapricum desulfuricans]
MYERTYDTDWDALERDEAMSRAFAIGVAASLGHDYSDEYERIVAEMDTSYDRSIVELAFEEGKNKAKKARHEADNGDEDDVWSELVEGETVTVDRDEVPTGGQNRLPAALDKTEILDRSDIDSRDRVSKPDFLDK